MDIDFVSLGLPTLLDVIVVYSIEDVHPINPLINNQIA